MEYASKSAEPKTAQAGMSMELAAYIDARRKWLMHERAFRPAEGNL